MNFCLLRLTSSYNNLRLRLADLGICLSWLVLAVATVSCNANANTIIIVVCCCDCKLKHVLKDQTDSGTDEVVDTDDTGR